MFSDAARPLSRNHREHSSIEYRKEVHDMHIYIRPQLPDPPDIDDLIFNEEGNVGESEK